MIEARFGLRGDHLAVRRPFAQGVDFGLVRRFAPGEVVRQQAVHHHVGIAADGRREVRVAGKRQSVVADVVGRVVGFGHGAHGHRRNGVLLGRTLDLREELVHLPGDGAAFRGFEDVAEAEDELPEPVELLLARGVVHAIDHRARHGTALFAAAVAAELRHAAVGQQHELLDHLVRFLLLLEVDAQRPAVLVEPEFHLLAVERDRAVAEPLAAQSLGQTVERQNLLGVVAAARLDHLLRLGVGEAAVGVDHRAAEPFVENLEVLVEREDRRETETRLVGAQRAELVREPLGQHRHGAVHQIDRRAALYGLVVDRRVRADVVRDVGDVHADLPHAVAHPAHRQRVVEVLGVGRVHGEGHRVAEVAPRGDLPGRDPGVDGPGGPLDLLLEAVGEFVFGQNGVHLRIVVAGHAQPLDQLAHGAFAARLPVGDAHHDLLAVADVGARAFRQVDVHGHPARVGAHEDLVRAHLRHTHVGLAVAFDDARDLAFEFPVAAAVHHGHLHAVAVEGVGGVALIDENIVFEPFDPHVHRARGGHVGHALVVGQVLLREAVLLPCALLDDPLLEEPPEDFERLAAALLRGASRGRGQVLERELVVGSLAEKIQYHGRPVRLRRASLSAAGVLLFHCLLSICNARRPMKPMPASMAPSSGENEDVWGRPAAAPTPSR